MNTSLSSSRGSSVAEIVAGGAAEEAASVPPMQIPTATLASTSAAALQTVNLNTSGSPPNSADATATSNVSKQSTGSAQFYNEAEAVLGHIARLERRLGQLHRETATGGNPATTAVPSATRNAALTTKASDPFASAPQSAGASLSRGGSPDMAAAMAAPPPATAPPSTATAAQHGSSPLPMPPPPSSILQPGIAPAPAAAAPTATAEGQHHITAGSSTLASELSSIEEEAVILLQHERRSPLQHQQAAGARSGRATRTTGPATARIHRDPQQHVRGRPPTAAYDAGVQQQTAGPLPQGVRGVDEWLNKRGKSAGTGRASRSQWPSRPWHDGGATNIPQPRTARGAGVRLQSPPRAAQLPRAAPLYQTTAATARGPSKSQAPNRRPKSASRPVTGAPSRGATEHRTRSTTRSQRPATAAAPPTDGLGGAHTVSQAKVKALAVGLRKLRTAQQGVSTAQLKQEGLLGELEVQCLQLQRELVRGGAH